MTNRQWLESLTDEELAKALSVGICLLCGFFATSSCLDDECNLRCSEGLVNWLQTEHTKHGVQFFNAKEIKLPKVTLPPIDGSKQNTRRTERMDEKELKVELEIEKIADNIPKEIQVSANICSRYSKNERLTIARYLYNAGVRFVPEGTVVLSK